MIIARSDGSSPEAGNRIVGIGLVAGDWAQLDIGVSSHRHNTRITVLDIIFIMAFTHYLTFAVIGEGWFNRYKPRCSQWQSQADYP